MPGLVKGGIIFDLGFSGKKKEKKNNKHRGVEGEKS
jgi:hypothetical protein